MPTLPHVYRPDRRFYRCIHCRETGSDPGECWARWRSKAAEMEAEMEAENARLRVDLARLREEHGQVTVPTQAVG